LRGEEKVIYPPTKNEKGEDRKEGIVFHVVTINECQDTGMN